MHCCAAQAWGYVSLRPLLIAAVLKQHQDELNSVNDTLCRYDKEGHPAFASARLWDDGILDPADTRRVLGLSLAAAQHSSLSPIPHYGVFRM